MNIAYLHGLNSDPNIEKVSYLESVSDNVYAPFINHMNPTSYKNILKEIKSRNIDLIIGSSMGGWFAYNISTLTGIPTLQFNPGLQGRSVDPAVTSGNKQANHIFVFGKKDSIIDPVKTRSWIRDNIKGKHTSYTESNGHRTPIDIFKKYTDIAVGRFNETNESKSNIFLTYNEFVSESTSGQIIKPKRGKVVKFDHNKYPELAKEFYDLIQTAYKEIGGHVKIKKPTDIYSDPKWNWWAGKDIHGTADFDLIMFGQKTNFGIKFSGVGHDGERDSKREYLKDRSVDLKKLGYYVEVSGKLADILISKYNVPVIEDPETVKDVLGKPISWEGSHPEDKSKPSKGWYTRYLAGKPMTKVLLGRPKI